MKNNAGLVLKRSLPLALSAALLMSACTRPGAPGAAGAVDPSAERITVEKGSVENRVVATGKVIARSQTSIAFARPGRVAEVIVKEGEKVKAGQALARLDSTDLKTAADQQWANYLSALAAYSQTVKGPTASDITAAEAAVTSAEAAYNDLGRKPSANSLASLRSTIANAETTLRQRQSAIGTASPELASVTEALQTAEATLKVRQAAYDRRAARDPGVGASSEALDLERATNDWNTARANYDRALQNGQVDLERAQNDLARAKADYNARFEKPTAAQFASAQAQIEQAKKNLAALQPAAELIQQRDAQAKQAWFGWKSADDALKNATITAPFDGLVTKVNINIGDWANTGVGAVQLADFAVPVFEMDVDEVDLGSVKPGQSARVRLQTYPESPLDATVESVSLVGTTAGAVVTYKVKLALGKAQSGETPSILVNMSGTGEIVTAQATDALVIPTRALVIDTTTRAFSVQKLLGSGDQAKIESVPVRLGFRDADRVEVVDGIAAGDTIVVPAVKTLPSNGGPGGN
jgi:multidrug efflux pump subunit AcrA (membrane-fusion protein)